MVMSFAAMTARWRGLRPVQNALARLTAITLGLLWLAWLPRPHTVCPLLMLTGVPCPFCGGTHAGIDLGRGPPAPAFPSSPPPSAGPLAAINLPVLRPPTPPRPSPDSPPTTPPTLLLIP